MRPQPDDLDWKPLEEVFRARTLKLLVRREKIIEERARMLRSRIHSGFQVFADRRIEDGGRRGLESLLDSMERCRSSSRMYSFATRPTLQTFPVLVI